MAYVIPASALPRIYQAIVDGELETSLKHAQADDEYELIQSLAAPLADALGVKVEVVYPPKATDEELCVKFYATGNHPGQDLEDLLVVHDIADSRYPLTSPRHPAY